MGFLVMLRDSLRESLDRRSLVVVIVISTIFILICAGIGYEQVTIDTALKEMEVKFCRAAGTGWENPKINVRFEVSDVKKAGPEPGREEFEGGTSFRVRAFPFAEFQKHVLYSRAVKNRKPRETIVKVPGISEDYKQVLEPPDAEDLVWFIGAKLRDHNFQRPKVELEKIEGDSASFKVWLKPGTTKFISASFRLNIFFGALVYDLRDMSIGDVVFMIQNTIAGLIAGWVGILIAIVSTAAFIPNMVQKGTVDLLLARPMPRWRIFLYKYLGGLSYVMIAAGYLIVGSWLVMALRSGIWSPGFLLSWPLLVFFFAALYTVSALIGLLTRSAIAAILLSAVTWFVVSQVGNIHLIVHNPVMGADPNSTLVKLVDGVHAVLPRLKDVDQAMLWCQLKANGITPERLALMGREAVYPVVDWVALFGVTGAWMAALLALGCWRFSKRDY